MTLDERYEARGRNTLTAATQMGLVIEPFGTRGALRVVGVGVDILLADPRALTLDDLAPFDGYPRAARRGRRPGAA